MSFISGFEKRANQRQKNIEEIDDFNKSVLDPGKTIGGTSALGAGIGGILGLVGGGLGGALRGAGTGGGVGAGLGGLSYIHQKNRGTDYLDKLDDKTLASTAKSIKKYKAGDKKALIRNFWQQQVAKAKTSEQKALFQSMLEKEG